MTASEGPVRPDTKSARLPINPIVCGMSMDDLVDVGQHRQKTLRIVVKNAD